MSNILKKIKQILGRQFSLNVDQIQPEANFKEELGADSRDFLEIITILEEEFDIEINQDEATFILTVDDAIKYIEHKLAKTN